MNLAVVGSGHVANFLLGFPTRSGVEVSYICDNNSKKWGDELLGYKIYPVEHLLESPVERVIVAVKDDKSIIDQLLNMKFDPKIIVSFKEDRLIYGDSNVDDLFIISRRRLEDDVDMIIKNLLEIKEMIGHVECRQLDSIDQISKSEFRIFSQNREDGIIQYLIKNMRISEKKFVEFGVQNYIESNTRFLLCNDNWVGLVIDGNRENIDYIKSDEIYMKYNLTAVHRFITAENINSIISDAGYAGKIGILSIDIDGNDYWVWKEINVIDPDIVICEYNPRFGKDEAVTIPYDPEWTRFKVSYTGAYFGASIRALTELGNTKGYALVASDSHGANLFFVKKELLNDRVKEVTVEQAYVKNNYRDTRDKNGLLDYLSFEKVVEKIHDLPLVHV
ncbi:hypothetical protein QYZ88_009175 [Lachnospiraceae bacterium C1.1]|nr:hypothetical protein [Lachnospiraceae bacterium C1.1]